MLKVTDDVASLSCCTEGKGHGMPGPIRDWKACRRAFFFGKLLPGGTQLSAKSFYWQGVTPLLAHIFLPCNLTCYKL
jgi:hypothetical protein